MAQTTFFFGDNSSFHTSKYAKEFIYEKNTEIIPSVEYCSDLNPVEKFFL
jgi:hypothetical protein